MIVIDVGNTRSKFAWIDWAVEGPLPRCARFLAVPHGRPIPWDALSRWCGENGEVRGAIAGGRPEVVAGIVGAWRERFGWELLRVQNHGDVPLEVAVDAPQRVGIDRLLNAVAANRLRPSDRAVIVVDSGTATTVDLLDAHGVFRGGAILPGMQLSADALHEYTALLPRVSVGELAERVDAGKWPEPAGRNTRDAIRSGILWGQLGAVRQLVELLGGYSGGDWRGWAVTAGRDAAMAREDRGPARENAPTGPLLVVTGGAGRLLASFLPSARYERALPLQGLALSARWMWENAGDGTAR